MSREIAMLTGARAPLAVDVRGLRIEMPEGSVDIVDDVSFSIRAGEVLGLVGESGSGKTTVGMALLGYARGGARIAAGTVHVSGDSGANLLALGPEEKGRVRGKTVAYVPQDPASALNPALRVRIQLAEVSEAHEPATPPEEIERRIGEVMIAVGLPSDKAFLDRYPHQLSGGQQQRVVIAAALIARPEVVIFDEPTTGLDVATQAQIIDMIREICAHQKTAGLFISHDLGVIAQNAEQLLVMYGGTVVESGMTEAVFARRAHPYTRGLFAARPQLQAGPAAGHLPTIAGAVPELVDLPAGCPFAGRCAHTQDDCYVERPQPRTLQQPSMAAPASLASWRQPHVARCLYAQVLTAGART